MTLTALATRNDALRRDLDRAIRQRNVLLKQSGGRLDEATAVTLDVWDGRMAELGDRMGVERAALVERLQPLVVEAYSRLAGVEAGGKPRLRPGMAAAWSWLRRSLDHARTIFVAASPTVGPHRDDVELCLPICRLVPMPLRGSNDVGARPALGRPPVGRGACGLHSDPCARRCPF